MTCGNPCREPNEQTSVLRAWDNLARGCKGCNTTLGLRLAPFQNRGVLTSLLAKGFDKGYNMLQVVSNIVQARATLAAYLAVCTCCSCGWKAMQVTGPRWPRKALSSLNSAKCVCHEAETRTYDHLQSLLWFSLIPTRKSTSNHYFPGDMLVFGRVLFPVFQGNKCNWHHLKTWCQDLRCRLHCWRRYHLHGNQA